MARMAGRLVRLGSRFMSSDRDRVTPRVKIIGGGVAGLETALALADLAPSLAEVCLITPDPDFVYKPLFVEEPFTGKPPPQFALEPLLADLAGTTVVQGCRCDRSEGARDHLEGGHELGYDLLVVVLGGVPRTAFADVVPFWAGS